VVLQAVAMASRWPLLGNRLPFSQFVTVASVTPQRRASSACVISPMALRIADGRSIMMSDELSKPLTPTASEFAVSEPSEGDTPAMNLRWPVTERLRNAMRARMTEEGQGAQKRVADAAGITETTLSNILSGRNKGSEHLPKVCEAMGLDMWEFMPLDDEQRRVLRALDIARKAKQGEKFTNEVEGRAEWLAGQKPEPPAIPPPTKKPKPAPPRLRHSSED